MALPLAKPRHYKRVVLIVPSSKKAAAEAAAVLAGIDGELFDSTQGFVPNAASGNAVATRLRCSIALTLQQYTILKQEFDTRGLRVGQSEWHEVDHTKPEKVRDKIDDYKTRKNMKSRRPA